MLDGVIYVDAPGYSWHDGGACFPCLIRWALTYTNRSCIYVLTKYVAIIYDHSSKPHPNGTGCIVCSHLLRGDLCNLPPASVSPASIMSLIGLYSSYSSPPHVLLIDHGPDLVSFLFKINGETRTRIHATDYMK